jgi:isocitrate dehydrogenase
MDSQITITVLPGDGIGPEIMASTQKVLAATGLPLAFDVCEAGAKSFARGISSGVPPETLASILRHKVVLKAPLETPIGHGGKSANVTLRKLCNTYANVRPARSIPGVLTPFSDRNINFTVIRENIEDLYAGIEYMQTPTVAEGLKIITASGCEQIIRFAFEWARKEKRPSLHCLTKANIMKMTEGLLKRTFEKMAPEYPEIKTYHMLVDNCAHQLVRHPEQFDTLVCTNLHGDILSDLAAGLVGGLGIAPSANFGPEIAFFEAVHGSAPDIAGQDKANPTALLLSSFLLLRHIGYPAQAAVLEKALFQLLEKGKIRTGDLLINNGPIASCSEFTDALIQEIHSLTIPAATPPEKPAPPLHSQRPPDNSKKELVLTSVGIDLFIQNTKEAPILAKELEQELGSSSFFLKNITNRGTQVYPLLGETNVDCVDCYACRLLLKDEYTWSDSDCFALLDRLSKYFTWLHIEKLWKTEQGINYSLAQGEEQ